MVAFLRLGTYYLFLPLGIGHLFEVGAHSRLGAYNLNKYGVVNSLLNVFVGRNVA